jgi:uncharacterized membrane protein
LLPLVIVCFIAFDYAYGQTRTLSAPDPVSIHDGLVAIPVAKVSDGDLHRFIVPETGVRFIVLKTDQLHVAFDACEICGSQGYIQESGAIICLNCAADINPSTIGQGGGCNPIPLASQNSGGMILIRASDLQKKASVFHSDSGHSH